MKVRPVRLLLAVVVLTLAAPAVAEDAPRVPPGRDPGGVAVALIGSGLNYTRPELASRLARDGEGELVGYDFVTNDVRPFQRLSGELQSSAACSSGTGLAALMLREAPDARIVPIRVDGAPAMQWGRAVAFTAETPARIAVLIASNPERADWEPFGRAAAHFAEILFIAAAGMQGADLDREPRFPAALGLANVLVVTATDAHGGLVPGANRGARTVDVAVPAPAADGDASSCAAARVAALAARLVALEPALKGAQLKARLVALASPFAGPLSPTRAGWIAAPNLAARGP